MAGAEGVDIHGRSANHTMNQKSSGQVTGASHTPGGNPKSEVPEYDSGSEDDNMHADSSVYQHDDDGAEESLTSGATVGGHLIFPPSLGASKGLSNYMGFSAFEIVGGFVSKRDREKDYQLAGEKDVFLPIPTNPSAQYNQGWNSQDVNALQTSIGQTLLNDGGRNLGKSIEGYLNNNSGDDGGRHPPRSSPLTAFKEMFKNATPPDLTAGLTAAGVGIAADTVGQPIMQALGIASFSETAVTYGGPSYREFSFTYSLKPASATESAVIDNIIMTFKKCSSAKQTSKNLYRIYSLPYVFEIKYYYVSTENEWLHKMGMCACTNVSVNYGGDRFATFDKGQPSVVQLSLSFKEIELLDRDRIEQGF